MRRLVVLLICACALPVPSAHAWTWPVDGPVLRPFSFDRAHPYAAGQHRGIDIGAPTGTSVLAPVEGLVSFAGTVPTGGKTVSIQTAAGYTATLVHLGSIAAARGARVTEHTVVGTVGPSGVAEGSDPYVYFGVRVTNEPQGYVDPLALLPPRAAGAPAHPAAEASAAVVSDAGAVTETVVAQPAASGVAVEAAPTAEESIVSAEPVESAAVSATTQPAAVEATRATSESGTQARRGAVEQASPEATARVARSATTRAGGLMQAARAASRRRSSARERSTDSDRPDAATRSGSNVVRVSSPVRAGSVAVRARGETDRSVRLPLAVAALLLVSAALGFVAQRKRARIMGCLRRERVVVDTAAENQDSGRPGLALRGREETPGPCGGLRGAGRHLRAVPPAEGQRRPDGQRDRRTWDAGDGHGRQRRRLAA